MLWCPVVVVIFPEGEGTTRHEPFYLVVLGSGNGGLPATFIDQLSPTKPAAWIGSSLPPPWSSEPVLAWHLCKTNPRWLQCGGVPLGLCMLSATCEHNHHQQHSDNTARLSLLQSSQTFWCSVKFISALLKSMLLLSSYRLSIWSDTFKQPGLGSSWAQTEGEGSQEGLY